MKKTTVTIGIPAYNEGQNIAKLLSSLVQQQLTRVEIVEILVVSDGSTDDTVEHARSLSDSRVSIFVNKTRKGKPRALSGIIAETNTDVLVLLDADIMISDIHFIERLTLPIVQEKADLTSARITQLSPTNFFQKLLYRSMQAKRKVFEDFREGNNIYTCHGSSRALSQRFYKAIDFTKATTGEDAYTYLFCNKHGFTYQYVTDTQVYYQLPKKLEDHERQSVRFLQSKILLYDVYGSKYVRSQFQLPRGAMLQSFIAEFFVHPLHTVLYGAVFLYMSFKALFVDRTQTLWLIARSTKKLTASLLSLVVFFNKT